MEQRTVTGDETLDEDSINQLTKVNNDSIFDVAYSEPK